MIAWGWLILAFAVGALLMFGAWMLSASLGRDSREEDGAQRVLDALPPHIVRELDLLVAQQRSQPRTGDAEVAAWARTVD